MLNARFTSVYRNVQLHLGVVELDLGQRSPMVTEVEVPKRLANHREDLSNQMARAGLRDKSLEHAQDSW